MVTISVRKQFRERMCSSYYPSNYRFDYVFCKCIPASMSAAKKMADIFVLICSRSAHSEVTLKNEQIGEPVRPVLTSYAHLQAFMHAWEVVPSVVAVDIRAAGHRHWIVVPHRPLTTLAQFRWPRCVANVHFEAIETGV